MEAAKLRREAEPVAVGDAGLPRQAVSCCQLPREAVSHRAKGTLLSAVDREVVLVAALIGKPLLALRALDLGPHAFLCLLLRVAPAAGSDHPILQGGTQVRVVDCTV